MKSILKKCTAYLVTLAMLITLAPLSAIPAFAAELSGTGMETDLILIETLADLETFRERVNDGENYEGKTVKLTADIDMSVSYGAGNSSWTPIGYYISPSENMPFKGTFDGGRHRISGLYINSEGKCQGLFGYIEKGGTVKNLTVSGDVKGATYVGIVAGDSSGTIERVITEGGVSGDKYVGGVVGRSRFGTIKESRNRSSVTGNQNVGGITGNILGVSDANSVVTQCANEGKITGESKTETLSDGMRYPDGNTTRVNESSSIGGIVGCVNSYPKVSECYNAGDISGADSVGGVVGHSSASVSDCYNIGSITGTEMAVGGICGRQINDQSGIKNVYNYGTVNADLASSDYGAICGFFYDSKVENAYYINTSAPSGSAATAQGAPLTADGLKRQENFTDFDFTNVWEMGADRPLLKNVSETSSVDTTIEISNLKDLEAFRDSVNGGDTFEGKLIKLTADIDMSEKYGANIGGEAVS